MALEPKERTRSRGGNTVLASAGLGDDPALAHPLREQRLAKGVVDLVGASVGEILALQEYPDRRVRKDPPYVELVA
jgi:hypothetical protein